MLSEWFQNVSSRCAWLNSHWRVKQHEYLYQKVILQDTIEFDEFKEDIADLESSGENKDAARALMRVKQKLDGYEGGDMRSIQGQVKLWNSILSRKKKFWDACNMYLCTAGAATHSGCSGF